MHFIDSQGRTVQGSPADAMINASSRVQADAGTCKSNTDCPSGQVCDSGRCLTLSPANKKNDALLYGAGFVAVIAGVALIYYIYSRNRPDKSGPPKMRMPRRGYL
jgi:Cys-rich repeat protein